MGRVNGTAIAENKHRAIMEFMLAHPVVPPAEIAKIFGMTKNHLSIIINSDVFKQAFDKLRQEMRQKLIERVVDLNAPAAEATVVALDTHTELMQNTALAPIVRQASADSVLDLGHAKAITKTASLNANVEVPPEAIKALTELAAKLATPFNPPKLQTHEGEPIEETSEASAAPTN